MAKKNKKDKAKTEAKKQAKQEKQLKKQDKKSNKNDDFEDLEALLNEFQEKDNALNRVSETLVKQPGIRSACSLVASPLSDEIYLFGGEHNKGSRTFVYNDLFVFNTKKETWSQVFVPNPPPPRSGHQAIITPTNGGEMWVFGGEFSSPSGNQFYHYKDLWVLNLKDLIKDKTASNTTSKWEQISAKNMKNGPSARSGHRICYHDKHIYIFGGFNERINEFIYFNDLYKFSVADRLWTKINCPTNAPSVRSACCFVALDKGLAVFGGYCKKRGKRKDEELGNIIWDGHFYNFEKNAWSVIRQGGNVPESRSGFSFSQTYSVKDKSRIFFFGGVADEEDDKNDDLDSEFFNDMHLVDVSNPDKFRWFPATIKGTEKFEPCPRMSSMSLIKDNKIYLFGGLYEDETKQITLNDFWMLDLKKMNGWNLINECDVYGSEWEDAEKSEDEEEIEDEEEEESESEAEADEPEAPSPSKSSKSKTKLPQKRKIKTQDKANWKFGRTTSSIFDNHPKPIDGEDFAYYWSRNSEYWLDLMTRTASMIDFDDEAVRADVMEEAAKEMSKAYYRIQHA